MKISSTIAAALLAIAGFAVNAEHTSRRLILGGETVEKDTKRYNVGLREVIDDDSYCSGVLISSIHVLTITLCLEAKIPNYVSVGTHYLNQTLDGEQIPVASVHFHPDFNPSLGSYDFVLLVLATPSKYEPIQLPKADDSDTTTNMTATAMGWGTTSFPDGDPSYRLQGVDLRVWKFEDCFALFDIDETSVCAGGVEGMDTCEMDTGGPLVKMEQTKGGENDILIGLIGWGYGCGQEGYPTVFSRVSVAVPWIESVIASP